jgi:hypothetical protein
MLLFASLRIEYVFDAPCKLGIDPCNATSAQSRSTFWWDGGMGVVGSRRSRWGPTVTAAGALT